MQIHSSCTKLSSFALSLSGSSASSCLTFFKTVQSNSIQSEPYLLCVPFRLEVSTGEPLVTQVTSNAVEEVTTEAPAVPEVIFINADSEPLTIIPRYTSPHLASYLYDHYETRAVF